MCAFGVFLRTGSNYSVQANFYAPNFEKVGTYWFLLVRMYVCMCMYGGSRYGLETSRMDSKWKNSRRILLVFPE